MFRSKNPKSGEENALHRLDLLGKWKVDRHRAECVGSAHVPLQIHPSEKRNSLSTATSIPVELAATPFLEFEQGLSHGFF